MKIFKDIPLTKFKFWGPAIENVKMFSTEELEILDAFFSGEYPEGIEATEVNDWFWLYIDDLLEILGREDEIEV